MAYKHGVYNTEQATSLTVPIQGSAGLQVIFGTAPIHLAKDPAAAVNTPKLVYSYKEAVEAVGYSDDFENFTLCQSISACFQVFNVAPIILVNVLDPNKAAHVTQNQAESCDVVDGVVLYDKKYVLLNTLAVKNGSATLVAGSDYEAAHEDNGSVAITLLSTAAKEASSLTVSSTSLKPSGVTAADIVGGVDASTGKETGLELIRQIYPTLGMVPGLILAPGWSHTPTVAAALQAKTENINGNFNCSCLLDISADSDGAVVYTSVKGAKEALGASSAHAAALWPMVAVGEKKYYFSAMFAALTAYTDANNADVPYESPSNKDLRITATVLKDGTTVALDQQQANDVLNANGVITAINANGFKSWGNNTAAYSEFLDNLALLKGVTREPAKAATTTIRFTASATRTLATPIPAGTRVSSSGSIYFSTMEYAEIPAGSLTVDVLAECTATGNAGNGLAPGEVSTIVDPVPYITSAVNQNTTEGGADVENDESLAERVYLAPGAYSTAGPEDGYLYHAKKYNAAIGDVVATSDHEAGQVDIVFIMADGSKPGAAMISGLQAYLSGKTIRPMTDKLTVKAPEEVTYSINLTYYINRSDSARAVAIQAAVAQAVEEYKTWQRTIGRDVNPSQLAAMVMEAGAKRVTVTAPTFAAVAATKVAALTGSATVTYGGLEDD